MKGLMVFRDTIRFRNVSILSRYKAFTLIELIVTMLLGGLIVLAAFQVINNFTSLSILMSRNNENYSKILQFNKVLRHDMQQSLKIVHYDDETIFYMPEELYVSYKWRDDYMIRAVNEQTDTFFVKVNSWHLINNKATNLPAVLEMEFESDEHESELHRIVKEYNNCDLFNNSELNNSR